MYGSLDSGVCRGNGGTFLKKKEVNTFIKRFLTFLSPLSDFRNCMFFLVCLKSVRYQRNIAAMLKRHF